MKIAILLTGPFLANGVCRVAVSWGRVLARGGHDVTLVGETWDAPPPDVEGCRVVTYPRVPMGDRRVRLEGLQREVVRAAGSLAREGPVDLYSCHEWYASLALRHTFPDARIAQTIHSPFIDENRLNNWKYAPSLYRRLSYPATRLLARRVELAGLRAIDVAHTLSRYTWKRLGALYPDVQRRIPWQRIPGTFDEERFKLAEDRGRVRDALGIPRAAKILLTVRRLVPRNGVDRILECARRVRRLDEPVLFLIGGSGPLEAQLHAEIDRHGLRDVVRMLGFVSEEELPAYYQAADAFLLPTRDLECFGLPVIEGMACGATPLIVPDGGPPELVEDPGCIAAANTTEAFAELVERFVAGATPAGPASLAEAAQGRFSEAAVAPAILEFAEAAAEGRPRAANC